MSHSSIEIKLFARLREAAGQEAFHITIPQEGMLVEDVLNHEKTTSVLGTVLNEHGYLVAINKGMARPGDAIRPGDEVALFPPVTGG